MNREKRVIIVVPAYNEEGKIGQVVARIKKEASGLFDEILVVDDGSTDATKEEARNESATVISHERKTGVGAALRTGIEYSSTNEYDIAVIMGGDNQDSPSEMKRLLNPLLSDDFDFVQGSRYMLGGRISNIPIFRLITTRIYAMLFKFIFGFAVSDGTNGYRAFKLNILENKEINLRQEWLNHYELEPYLFYKAIALGFKVSEAPVTKSYPMSKVGYTKMIPILGWWSILRPIILLKLKIRK